MGAAPDIRIEDEAASWLIRLDSGQVSAADKSAFDAWLEANPRHRVAFLRQQVVWKRIDRLKALGALEGIDDSRWSDWRRWAIPAAAATIVVAILSVWFTIYPWGWKTYSTDIGNSERVVLQDGSTMMLNTNSTARVRLTAQNRHVVLVRGEGHFEVAHDARRPFDVRANETVVRAVGTAFSVYLRTKDRVDVLVTQGRVAVSSSILTAGDAAVVRQDTVQLTKVPAADLPRKLAWRDGRLRFNGETLAEAVAEFNRYNHRQLAIADPAIAGLHVGGGFQTTDIDSFLVALEKSFGIRALSSSSGSQASSIRLTGSAPPQPN